MSDSHTSSHGAASPNNEADNDTNSACVVDPGTARWRLLHHSIMANDWGPSSANRYPVECISGALPKSASA